MPGIEYFGLEIGLLVRFFSKRNIFLSSRSEEYVISIWFTLILKIDQSLLEFIIRIKNPKSN